MPVTRRQLLLAKDNNEDERVAEFEKFFRADVGRAEKVSLSISRKFSNRVYILVNEKSCSEEKYFREN